GRRVVFDSAQDVGLRSFRDEIGHSCAGIDGDTGPDGQAAVAQIVHHALEARGRTHRDAAGAADRLGGAVEETNGEEPEVSRHHDGAVQRHVVLDIDPAESKGSGDVQVAVELDVVQDADIIAFQVVRAAGG